MKIILFLIYTAIIVVWVWARFSYFKVESQRSRIGSYLYDPVVVIHIVVTCFHYAFSPLHHATIIGFALFLYVSGLLVFLKTVALADRLNFAFSEEVGKLITIGTYGHVRHPLYISYSLVWLGSTLLFDSILLWITLIYLLAFYYFSAKKEEEAILKSNYSREYAEYSKNVGMFLPRIKGWKS